MRPGITRAVPMGILGFVLGMLILIVIRSLQQLQPPMDPQLAVVLGTFTAAAAFIWGLGAFDPRMNVHAHEPEEGAIEAVEEVEEPEGTPGEILGSYVWLLSTLLLGLLLILIVFALLPQGPALRTVSASDSLADVAGVGFVQLEIAGQVYEISQLLLLLAFVVFMFASLALFSGGLGMLFFNLSRGMTVVKEVEQTKLESEPMEHVNTSRAGMLRWGIVAVVVTAGFGIIDRMMNAPITNEFQTLSFFLTAGVLFTLAFVLLGYFIRFVAAQTHWLWLVRALLILGGVHLVMIAAFLICWFSLATFPLINAVVFNLILLGLLLALHMIVGAMFAIVSGILLPLFYFVLIGLVVAFPPPLLFIISASNALLVAALILRPRFVTHWLGYSAGWIARQMRRVPNLVQ